ncbi:PAS domain-containing protein [Cyclobacterium xiamenense]|uniref:PAS domain-containing protein n=1 Tax=Cyclobacterium xiamenense TaxID=1297121 RepID=UPI0035CF97AE
MESEKKQQVEKFLDSYGILNSNPEREFDTISQVAAVLFEAPMASITVWSGNWQFIKSQIGLESAAITDGECLSPFVMNASEGGLLVADAREDLRFRENPLVTGKPSIVFFAGVPIYTPEGHPLGALCVFDHKPRSMERDKLHALNVLGTQVTRILELRKSHQNLSTVKDSLEIETRRLNNILDATQVGTWEWDMAADKVIVNARYAEMVGYDLEELGPFTMDTWYSLVHPEDRSISDKILEECFARKRDYYSVECRLVHKKGHYVWINDRGRVTKWSEDGKPLMMSGTHTDITERKMREIQFQSISDNIPGVVYRYSRYADGRDALEMVSNGAARLWGFSAEMAMKNNRLIWDRYHPEDIEKHLETIRFSQENLSFWMHEWRYLHPDGSLRWHKGTGNPSKREDGSVVWDSVILDITERKIVEKALKHSEKRFRALVQGGADLTAILSADSRYLYVSPNYPRCLGYREEELLGKEAAAYFHPEDKDRIFADFADLPRKKRVKSNPYRYKRKDGSWCWLQSVATDLLADEAVQGIVINSVEITDLIQVQERLEQSEARYRGFYESQTNYVIRTDLKGNLTYANPKFIEDYGWLYPESMPLENSYRSFVLDQDRQKVAQSISESVALPDRVKIVEMANPKKEGGMLHTLWELICLPDAKGRPGEMQWIGINITGRISMENALKKSNERFEKIAEATNDAIWDYDVEKDNLFWGKGFHTLFGYDLETTTPSMKLLVELIHPEDRERIANKIQAFKQSKSLTNWFEEYRFLRSDGFFAFVMDRAIFIRNKQGRVTRVVGAMTDITYRKEYEESLEAMNQQMVQHARELERSNLELEQFAYVASHDLQEPLRMISNFMGLLERKYGSQLDQKAHQYIQFAVDGAKRMKQIILDLLEYSRIGKSEDKLKLIATREIVDEVCLLQKRVIKESGATIHCESLPAIVSFRIPLLQVFQNLIGNALKYRSPGQSPEIHIHAEVEGDFWKFFVRDNGIGIDPAYHEKIFIIFNRLHTKKEYPGTGMGLAIVKKIIDSLGGEIGLESAPGKGSMFYFTLPRVSGNIPGLGYQGKGSNGSR